MGDLNLNSLLYYETNEAVKNFFNLAIRNGLMPQINSATRRITRETATATAQTKSFSENDIFSGVLKADISDLLPIYHFKI